MPFNSSYTIDARIAKHSSFEIIQILDFRFSPCIIKEIGYKFINVLGKLYTIYVKRVYHVTFRSPLKWKY